MFWLGVCYMQRFQMITKKAHCPSSHIPHYSQWGSFYKPVTFKVMGPQARSMFYLETWHASMHADIFITKVSGEDLYLKFMHSPLRFLILFLNAGGNLVLFYDPPTVWNPALDARLPRPCCFCWPSHVACLPRVLSPQHMAPAPTHGCCSSLRALSPHRLP